MKTKCRNRTAVLFVAISLTIATTQVAFSHEGARSDNQSRGGNNGEHFGPAMMSGDFGRGGRGSGYGPGMMGGGYGPGMMGGGYGSGMMGGGYGLGMMGGGYGPGMMGGGYGLGMMGGGYGPGMMGGGYGPGMMGGGYGLGMMGGGYGLGMMGGGYGPGMMGGGYGPGMMGDAWTSALDQESLAEVNAEIELLRSKTREINGATLDIMPQLREALSKEKPDPTAVGAIYSKLFDLQKKLIEQRIATRNTVRAIVEKASNAQVE